MKLDAYRLISEVEKRRELWDSTLNMSVRKDVGTALWQEVADVMQMEVHPCKKRFKGLRDSYRAEVRKIQKRQITHSNWPYFRPLEFLRIIFDPDKLVPFSPEPINSDVEYTNCVQNCKQNKLDDFIIDVDNDDSFDFEIMGDIFKRESSDTLAHDSGSNMSAFNMPAVPFQQSEHTETPSTLLQPPPLELSMKRARLCPTPSTELIYVNGCSTPIKSSLILSDLAKDDPDYNFLVSLLPHLKTLSNMNNMKFRTDVSRMLMDLNQQERESEPLSNVNHMHKVIPASTTSKGKQNEPVQFKSNVPNTPNGSSSLVTHSSIIECDVKIENELI